MMEQAFKEAINSIVILEDQIARLTVKKDPQVTFAKDLSMWLPKMDGK